MKKRVERSDVFVCSNRNVSRIPISIAMHEHITPIPYASAVGMNPIHKLTRDIPILIERGTAKIVCSKGVVSPIR